MALDSMKLDFKYRMLFVVLLVMSCGPKKGIITKKKYEHPKRVEDATTTVPDVNVPKKTHTSEKEALSETEQYIAQFAEIAKAEMRTSKIPASITLAQGILESGSGKGRLAREANNHFGIKCHGWKGAKIYHNDDRSQECFRKYKRGVQSYKDHSKFLTGRQRYSDLFKLEPDDYKGWAKGLRAAGYATDRKYPQKLISLIERYKLYKYDELILANKKFKKVKVNHGVTRYIIEQGDTLYSLSKRYNTTVEAIKELNSLYSNTLTIGQELMIPN